MLKKQVKIKENSVSSQVEEITISSIVNPSFHDRSMSDDSELWHLAQSMNQLGLISPITVRKLDDQSYERISGYRRVEAAKKLGWQKINCIVVEANDKDAVLMMLTENIQRENINDYDLVVSLIHLIAVNLNMTEDDVKSFLHKMNNHNSGNLKSQDLSYDDKAVKKAMEEVLVKTEKYELNNLARKLRVLNLNPILIENIQANKVGYTNALELNKIKDDNALNTLLAEVIQKNLSKEIVKAKVKEIIGDTVVHIPFTDITRKFRDFYKLPADKQSIIQAKMKEIQDLMAS